LKKFQIKVGRERKVDKFTWWNQESGETQATCARVALNKFLHKNTLQINSTGKLVIEIKQVPMYELCPKCKVNRPVLKEMLEEPRGTENRETAQTILNNCAECRKYIEGGNNA
jgi:hypothetical protein